MLKEIVEICFPTVADLDKITSTFQNSGKHVRK